MTPTYLIDTSAYSDFSRGDARLKSVFTASNELLIPLIVIAELRTGFVAGTKTKQNEALLQQFLDAPNVRTVSINDQTTRIYASIYLQLRKSGQPIGTNDIWIAATALEHGVTLATTDNDFSAIAGLKLAKLTHG